MKKIRIATRASYLALAQTEIIKNTLKKLFSDIEISVVRISTRGDKDKSDFLYKSDSIGFFTSEVESAILNGKADIAVHSLKDLPTKLTPGLVIAAIPERDSPADALVAKDSISSIADLPAGATVGTSSLRRIAQLRNLRPDIKCVPLRGNIETRISKIFSGKIDAAIVACAGLNRLGLEKRITEILEPTQFLPAPAQGALAVQTPEKNAELTELIARLNHEPARSAAETERALLAAMQGGCSIPVGAYATVGDNLIKLHAMIGDIDGKNIIKRSGSAPSRNGIELARELAKEMLAAGGKNILDKVRKNNLKN